MLDDIGHRHEPWTYIYHRNNNVHLARTPTRQRDF